MNIVITGVSSGMGKALTQFYLAQGAKVFGIDVKEASLFDKSYAHGCADVSQMESLKKLTPQIEQWLGKPDLWINNAGIAHVESFEKISIEAFERVIGVNFLGVVHGTRLAMEMMSSPVRGTIVNVSSLNGLIPAPFMTAYCASKYAVTGFTRSLSLELEQAHSSLKVLLVLPGFVKTAIMENHGRFEFPDKLKWIVENPEQAAAQIARGISQGRCEILVSNHTKFLEIANRLFPHLVPKSARFLVSKTWKELLGISPIR